MVIMSALGNKYIKLSKGDIKLQSKYFKVKKQLLKNGYIYDTISISNRRTWNSIRWDGK